MCVCENCLPIILPYFLNNRSTSSFDTICVFRLPTKIRELTAAGSSEFVWLPTRVIRPPEPLCPPAPPPLAPPPVGPWWLCDPEWAYVWAAVWLAWRPPNSGPNRSRIAPGWLVELEQSTTRWATTTTPGHKKTNGYYPSDGFIRRRQNERLKIIKARHDVRDDDDDSVETVGAGKPWHSW